jgi:hypothetical protein
MKLLHKQHGSVDMFTCYVIVLVAITSSFDHHCPSGSHLCVFPRKLIPQRRSRIHYDRCAANGTTVQTYGWLLLASTWDYAGNPRMAPCSWTARVRTSTYLLANSSHSAGRLRPMHGSRYDHPHWCLCSRSVPWFQYRPVRTVVVLQYSWNISPS